MTQSAFVGKVAIVTGPGIGRAVVLQRAAQGAAVAVVDSNLERHQRCGATDGGWAAVQPMTSSLKAMARTGAPSLAPRFRGRKEKMGVAGVTDRMFVKFSPITPPASLQR